MTLEQANNLKNGDMVIDKKNKKMIRICFRRSEDWFECAYIKPEFGWCNRQYKDLELA